MWGFPVLVDFVSFCVDVEFAMPMQISGLAEPY